MAFCSQHLWLEDLLHLRYARVRFLLIKLSEYSPFFISTHESLATYYPGFFFGNWKKILLLFCSCKISWQSQINTSTRITLLFLMVLILLYTTTTKTFFLSSCGVDFLLPKLKLLPRWPRFEPGSGCLHELITSVRLPTSFLDWEPTHQPEDDMSTDTE